MRVKPGVATAMEKEFAKHYERTGDARYSAEKAGYRRAAKHAYEIAKRPDVQESVRKIQARIMENELLPLAVGRLRRILADDQQKTSDHIAAAKAVILNTIGRNDASQDKAPEDMTAADIAYRLAELRLKLAAFEEAENTIDLKPNTPPESDVFG